MTYFFKTFPSDFTGLPALVVMMMVLDLKKEIGRSHDGDYEDGGDGLRPTPCFVRHS